MSESENSIEQGITRQVERKSQIERKIQEIDSALHALERSRQHTGVEEKIKEFEAQKESLIAERDKLG